VHLGCIGLPLHTLHRVDVEARRLRKLPVLIPRSILARRNGEVALSYMLRAPVGADAGRDLLPGFS
jgi:hypothetical protein